MGRRRKTGGEGKPYNSDRKDGAEMGIDKKFSLLDPTSREFVYDEVDDYEDERDHLSLSLAQALMARPRAPKEQVLGIDVSSSEDDEEEEESDQDAMYMEDDIVEEQEDQLPDERAWGSKKWRYIGTDTTDEKIHKLARKQDEELARLEEETARKLQERMAAELDHLVAEDLLPQDMNRKDKKTVIESTVTVDLSGLSRTKKLQLLKRESPEFLPLLEDLKEKLKELRTFLRPLAEGVNDGHITDAALCQYLTTKYRLVLNYVCVLCVYMMTKSSIGVVGQHPVVGRLAQYRQLLQELLPCDEKLKPQLQDLLPKIKIAITAGEGKASRKPRQLQLLTSMKNRMQVKKRRLSELLEEPEHDDSKQKRKKEPQHLEAKEDSSDEEQQRQAMQEEGEGEGEREKESLDPEGKRAITYQIAKNKGLTPSRKKEQRNPRVKYRRKYQTKLKKRKGQVRLVRKEIKRYEGEVSGIKAHTIKSIKIK